MKNKEGTIINVLDENWFNSWVACKKPLISVKNCKLRFEFTKALLDNGMDFWKRVLLPTKVNVTFSEVMT